MLECFEGIFFDAFIQASQVLRTKTKGVGTCKMMEIPANEHPIKAIIITDKYWSVFTNLFQPLSEIVHNKCRLFKGEGFFSWMPWHRQCFRNIFIRDGFQLTLKSLIQMFIDQYSSKRNHRIISGNWTIAFNIYHYIRHNTLFKGLRDWLLKDKKRRWYFLRKFLVTVLKVKEPVF